jgi:hypothetical protein
MRTRWIIFAGLLSCSPIHGLTAVAAASERPVARYFADAGSERRIQSAAESGAQNGSQNRTTIVDGIAARIEGDVLTESELNELSAFQRLVDGKATSRDELIRELTDQWIVNNEAQTSQFPRTSARDVDQALASLEKQSGSHDDFQKRLAELGLTENAVRRQLDMQIYLERFLDYKFRPAAQIDEQQIDDYYNGEFTKQAQAHGQAVPPLDEVHAEIRHLLTERIITQRSAQWLDDTRARLRIEILNGAGAS